MVNHEKQYKNFLIYMMREIMRRKALVRKNNVQVLMKRFSEIIESSGEINEAIEMLKNCTGLEYNEYIDESKGNDMKNGVLFKGARKGVFAKGEKIVLKHIEDNEYGAYEEVLYENSIMKNAFEEPEFMQFLWRDLRCEQSLYLSVYDEDEFCGYCGIKDTGTRTPEIAVELLKRCHGRGVAYKALLALMKEYAQAVEIDYFLSRVDAENRASISLMKKLGGTPFGLSNLLITCEEEKARLEKEYVHLINENVRALASEWQVEPQKLISHALVFRFDLNELKSV